MSQNIICWNGEEDELLIEFVRDHETLYNVKCKDYKKFHLKQYLWCEIGGILNKTDVDCRKRWNYVRDYYIRRRGIKTVQVGESATKRAALLSFLDDYSTSKRGSVFNAVIDDNSRDIYQEDSGDKDSSQVKPNDATDVPCEDTSSSDDDEMMYILNDNKQQQQIAKRPRLSTWQPPKDKLQKTVQRNLSAKSDSHTKKNSVNESDNHLLRNSINESDNSSQRNSMNESDNYLERNSINESDNHLQRNLSGLSGNHLQRNSINHSDNNTKKYSSDQANCRNHHCLSDCHTLQRESFSDQLMDETDHFFASMSKIVKTLPRYERAQLRMQISTLVGNAELQHISKQVGSRDGFSSDLVENVSVQQITTTGKASTSIDQGQQVLITKQQVVLE